MGMFCSLSWVEYYNSKTSLMYWRPTCTGGLHVWEDYTCGRPRCAVGLHYILGYFANFMEDLRVIGRQ